MTRLLSITLVALLLTLTPSYLTAVTIQSSAVKTPNSPSPESKTETATTENKSKQKISKKKNSSSVSSIISTVEVTSHTSIKTSSLSSASLSAISSTISSVSSTALSSTQSSVHSAPQISQTAQPLHPTTTQSSQEPTKKLSKKRQLSLSKSQKRISTLKSKRLKRIQIAKKQRLEKNKKATDYLSKRHAALKQTNIQKSIDKQNQLVKIAKKSKSGVLDLTLNQFRRFVVTSPRPYNLFVVLTAMNDAHKCGACKLMHDVVRQVAPQYRAMLRIGELSETLNRLARATDTATVERLKKIDTDYKKELPLMFIEMDASDHMPIFQELQLSTVPLIMFVPSTLSTKQPSAANLFTDPKAQKYRFMPQQFSADELNNFLKKHVNFDASKGAEQKTGSVAQLLKDKIKDLDAKRRGLDSIVSKLVNLAFGMTVVLAVLLLYYYCRGIRVETMPKWEIQIDRLSNLSFIKAYFIVAAWTFYLFAMGGGMYNIIRGTGIAGESWKVDWSKVEWKNFTSFDFSKWIETLRKMPFPIGSIENNRFVESWILPNQQMNQFANEGYLMSSMQLLIAATLVLLNQRAMSQKIITDGKSNLIEKFRNFVSHFTKWFTPMVILLLLCRFWCQFSFLYRRKNDGSGDYGLVWDWGNQQFVYYMRVLTLYFRNVLKLILQSPS